jgi:methylated-DNA-[protein]-cysteine S-methyltransferase
MLGGMDRLLIGSVAAPWGPIRLAAGEDGLVALEQRLPEEEFATRLERRFRGVVIARDTDPSALDHPGTPALARAREAVLRFLDGDLGALGDLPLVLDDRPAWDRRVLDAVRTIPPGATASYGEVARMAGSPGAARAVGGAVGRNPIGLAIPCHRVIAGDGSLGGYGAGWWGGREAGLELKTELLAREGVVVRTRAHR